MRPMRYRFETASIASERHPDRNEDAYFTLQHGVAGVMDGLGGHPGSEYASAFVSAYCQGALDRVRPKNPSSYGKILSRTLGDADRALSREFSRQTATQDIATTAILAAIRWDESEKTGSLYTAHAGDCRAHLCRDGRIIFTTLDHSLTHTLPLDEQRLIQDEIASEHYVHDVDPYDWPYLWQRNIVTSYLSAGYSHKRLRIDTNHTEIQSGDIILLTSDGVHDNLTTNEIASILVDERNPAFALVDAAVARSREPKEVDIVVDGETHGVNNFRPKQDDMTAVLLKIP